jgi:mannosyltransferase OCH1-like enzyme
MKAEIPKTIHYVWFGPKEKNELILSCIESWKRQCPEYVIKEWSEKNFNKDSHPFTKLMHAHQKWAFLSDYVRLHALYEEGGVYLDTDMYLVKPLDELLKTSLLLGKESPQYISCGMIGAAPHHPFIKSFMKEYDAIESLAQLRPNPTILTELFKKEKVSDVLVLQPNAFYPFSARTIKQYHGQTLPSNVYGVHLWNYSWGHPLNRLFKKIGIHYYGTHVLDKLGLKKMIKKLLGFV